MCKILQDNMILNFETTQVQNMPNNVYCINISNENLKAKAMGFFYQQVYEQASG